MLKHKDYCTLLKNREDKDILTRPLFDVNMRLYKSSPEYRTIIQECADYIWWLATTERKGYKKPHGFSGANAGIPFNIIALADGTQMINPRILEAAGYREVVSNCGSLMLEKPIKVWRCAEVMVEYWDLEGKRREVRGYLPTVQHEIDHNLGILITDRQVVTEV